jgi:hypothetical protein
MTPNLSRKFILYVSCHNGRIEIAEGHSAEGSPFLAYTAPAFFACGSADTKEQAWAIRHDVSEVRDPGVYFFHLPNNKMTDAKRREIVERVEKAYQEKTP